MDPTPDTLNYLIAGYVVFFIIVSVYIGSLINRWKYLQREMDLLKELEKEK